ncbi:NADH-quinone oxidoreductase subunit M [Parapedobacter sp. ISTM3]|uniref:NADH-quinone oxidoreductase subunit M n=1 Tax=Parapedobacter luteus TaxID=623280 RepID=A0A1T5EFD9_9SPHI|nr:MULTISPECIES: NADH-quinone oxidoreductase subunit M [Parapedobacter]MBK1441155.1 NADH-quinone oxidoreductase subunit M [Parapedobacter sp. ISTM3]SKB82410.1 NADH-quinone oxidoreductase subunit M [Parapedobacter luteus]
MDNLFILLLLPVFGALVLAFVQQAKAARQFALLVSLVSLAFTIPFLVNFVPDASMQFEQRFAWIPSLGIHFHVGIDGISLPLVLLTNGLVPLIILAAFSYDYKGGFYALVLFMQAGLLLVFTALDAFAFYVGWEVALIPIYFICALWGGENRIRVNLKFFIYTFLGSLLMLAAIIYLHLQVPTDDYALSSFYQLALDSSTQRWIFWAFFLAFAIKMPIFPFHTWQPDTYTEAPTAGTMLLAGIMLKMGVYGVIRWLIPVAPLGVAAYGQLALVLCIIGVVYASIIAFKQRDAKRLVAYSSIAHVGLIGAGVFAWNVQGVQGAIIQMVNHGISVVGLFFVLDIVARRLGTRDLAAMGGIAKPAPILAIVFLVIVMGAVGLPLTNGFVGEFLLLLGVYEYGVWYAVFGGLTLILGAVYMLSMYQKVMFGDVNEQTAAFPDIRGSEWLVLAVIVLLIIGIGVYPGPLLNISEAAVAELVDKVGLIGKN